MSTTAGTGERERGRLRADIPLILWLVAVWGALWGDWSIGNLVFGLLLAVLVTRVLILPPVTMSGRFNVVYFAVFVVTFIWQVARASFHVLRLALTQGPRVHNAMVGVHLRQNEDLLMTAVGHTMALIPGSLVVEVDRACGILYFHVLDVATEEQAESFRASTLRTEATWIRILGSRESLAELKREARGEDTTSSGALHSPTTQMQRVVAAGRGNRRKHQEGR